MTVVHLYRGDPWSTKGVWFKGSSGRVYISCPLCGRVSQLAGEFIIKLNGTVKPGFVCSTHECRFVRFIVLNGFSKAKAKRRQRAFTLLEMLIVVAVISVLICIAAASYRKAKWQAHVTKHAIENRGRLNQAVHDGKFKRQADFDAEHDRLRRQTAVGMKQGG